MSEKIPLTEQDFSEDFIAKFEEADNRYYQEVTVTSVDGTCPYGHKEGEVFRVTNCNNDGLCGALYRAVHSSAITLHYGGSIPWEKDPDIFYGLCPEQGRVQVEVKRIEKKDFTFLKTRKPARDMTGKGFRGLDEYRIFIEIIDVENNCAWGNRAGKRYEVDPFNTGGICGYLYSKIYSFINLYISGGSAPWEFEKNTIMSVCPDTYNQVTFKLIREKR